MLIDRAKIQLFWHVDNYVIESVDATDFYRHSCHKLIKIKIEINTLYTLHL